MNAITVHNRNMRASLPALKGHKARGWYKPQRYRRGKVEEYVGIKLVRWLIEHDRKDEARNLLEDIKAGKVAAI